jgi:hypothetical protein
MTFPNGAGYMDYEDVRLQLNDMVERVEVSDCCDYKVACISKTCLKCLRKAEDTTYKYFITTDEGSEEIYA